MRTAHFDTDKHLKRLELAFNKVIILVYKTHIYCVIFTPFDVIRWGQSPTDILTPREYVRTKGEQKSHPKRVKCMRGKGLERTHWYILARLSYEFGTSLYYQIGISGV
jgi:hypothetical protein